MDEKISEGVTVEERVLETQIKRLKAEVASLQGQLQRDEEDMKLDLGGQIEEAMCVLSNTNTQKCKLF